MLEESKKKEFIRRLILSRMRLLNTNGFYGLLLMHAEFAIDLELETAATDGYKIYFSPKFMDELSDAELDFVLMHEIMHMALRHCFRTGNRDPYLFNIACDIVVNSNILLSNDMDLKSISLKKWGESMHLTPDGKEGHEYTAEQVYEQLIKSLKKKKGKGKGYGIASACGESDGDSDGDGNGQGSTKGNRKDRRNKNGGWDSHGKWKDQPNEDDSELDAVWDNRLKDAEKAVEIRKATMGRGTIPMLAQRHLKELREAQTDWRTILANFVQEEIIDYSFSPPDRRFDGPFMLPDFNDTDIKVENILFMIDTSASMSDKMMTDCYAEVKGAIDQFGGKLKGWLGFFDATVVPPQPFEDLEGFKIIKPKGGGGTDFMPIFDYVEKKMQDTRPASIIILTDGFAPFPPESVANGIPVLWVINNTIANPPWGKVTTIKD